MVRVLNPPKPRVCESWYHSITQRLGVGQAWVEMQRAVAQLSVVLDETRALRDLRLGHRAVEACPL